MSIADLKDYQQVTYRLGRAGNSKVIWEPWSIGHLFVNRREHDLPARFAKRCAYWRAGDIMGLTIRDKGWAEYTQADYQGNGLFLAEDYYLEIEGIV